MFERGLIIGVAVGVTSTVCAVIIVYALLIDWFDRREKQDKFDGQEWD